MRSASRSSTQVRAVAPVAPQEVRNWDTLGKPLACRTSPEVCSRYHEIQSEIAEKSQRQQPHCLAPCWAQPHLGDAFMKGPGSGPTHGGCAAVLQHKQLKYSAYAEMEMGGNPKPSKTNLPMQPASVNSSPRLRFHVPSRRWVPKSSQGTGPWADLSLTDVTNTDFRRSWFMPLLCQPVERGTVQEACSAPITR